MSDKLINENMIVEQAKTDDRSFAVLYDFYFPKIYFFIIKRVGQKEAAEDIVSAIFLKVFTNLRTFRPKNDYSFAAWLYRIANNKLIDYYRGQGRRATVNIENITEPSDECQDPQADSIRSLNRAIVEKTMASLSSRDQQILQLKFFAELDNIEIAQSLGIKPNNVGVWLFRALKRFRAIYQKYE